MELIQNNPYRIAGIFAGATESELQRQKSKISKYASIGKEISSELDFSFLNKLDRNENEIKKAFSSLEQNHDKVRNALFWFINASPFDNTAIEYLKNGDIEKAFEIWEKVTKDKNVNSKNYSCFNNLGTLKLLGNSFVEIQEGIESKIKLIESDGFVYFINIVADETYSANNQKQIEILIDDLLSQVKNKFSQSDTINLFSNCNGSSQNYLLKKFTEEPIFKIESHIESTKSKRKENKKNAYEHGLKLFVNCKDDLASLKKILGVSDLKFKMIADNLSKEVMQCGIDYFKEWENTKDPTEEGLKLLKYAKTIAVSNQVLERIDSNIEGMEEFKDKEINQAIGLLQSIKEAYTTNETKIRAQVRIQELNLGYGQSINWTKVNELIRDSLDWDKVIELIIEVIPSRNIEKIKSNKDDSKIRQFKALVDFIIDKMSYYNKNRIKYLSYWKTVNTTTTTRTTTKTSTTTSSSSSSSGGCYIATMAYGSYDHPQVKILRGYRDETLAKSVLGRSFISFYYATSPQLVKLLKNQKYINKLIRNLLDKFIKKVK